MGWSLSGAIFLIRGCSKIFFLGAKNILIRARVWIEWCEMDSGWRKHCHRQIVRIDPLIVLYERSRQSDAIRILVVLLVRLAWPWKEKATRTAVLKTIRGRAAVQIKFGLDCTRQSSDTKAFNIVSTPRHIICESAVNVWPHHLRCYTANLELMIKMVFLIRR